MSGRTLDPETERRHLQEVDDFLGNILRKVRLAASIIDEEVNASSGAPEWERLDRALRLLAEARVSLRCCRRNELRPVLERARESALELRQ